MDSIQPECAVVGFLTVFCAHSLVCEWFYDGIKVVTQVICSRNYTAYVVPSSHMYNLTKLHET